MVITQFYFIPLKPSLEKRYKVVHNKIFCAGYHYCSFGLKLLLCMKGKHDPLIVEANGKSLSFSKA